MAEHIWYKNYHEVVAKDINPEQYQSLIDFLEQDFKKFSELTAYVNMGKELTYGEVDRLSTEFAAYLQSIGLTPGTHIAIQMPNLLQYPVVMFGAIKAGLVIVNTNPLYTPQEMEHQFKDAQVKALIVLANFADKVQEVLPNTEIKHVIITEVGDMLGGAKGWITNFVVKYVKHMVPGYDLPTAVTFKEAMRRGSAAKYTRPKRSLDDLTFLQYTGGTTGVAKGAELTHRNILANMLQIFEWFKPNVKVREEIAITALPLYHIFALTVNCLSMVHVGCKNVLVTNPRDMKDFIKTLKQYPWTLLTGVNTLFNGLLNQEDFHSVDFSNARTVVGGGMAVQKAVAERWLKVTGTHLAEGYGLSETSPVLSCNRIDGHERLGTIGLPMPGTEMKIMDEQGNEVPQGERGEICARGPQVMNRYWNKPEESKKAFFEGGWFRTGDVGIMDSEGYFSIVDRIKDMINVSGFNVYPNEVEDAIAANEKVLEVAAIGVNDDKGNERVKVFIVRKDQSLTEEEIINFAKKTLTAYKVPKLVEFRDELPKSNVGKILRKVLRDEEK